MSIPLKLYLAISLERKSVFRDSVEISFVDENDFVKEGK